MPQPQANVSAPAAAGPGACIAGKALAKETAASRSKSLDANVGGNALSSRDAASGVKRKAVTASLPAPTASEAAHAANKSAPTATQSGLKANEPALFAKEKASDATAAVRPHKGTRVGSASKTINAGKSQHATAAAATRTADGTVNALSAKALPRSKSSACLPGATVDPAGAVAHPTGATCLPAGAAAPPQRVHAASAPNGTQQMACAVRGMGSSMPPLPAQKKLKLTLRQTKPRSPDCPTSSAAPSATFAPSSIITQAFVSGTMNMLKGLLPVTSACVSPTDTTSTQAPAAAPCMSATAGRPAAALTEPPVADQAPGCTQPQTVQRQLPAELQAHTGAEQQRVATEAQTIGVAPGSEPIQETPTVLAQSAGPQLSTPANTTHAPAETHAQREDSATAADAPPQSARTHSSELPETLADMVATANSKLAVPHRVTKQQTGLLQAAFGDVQLLQDLRQMEGDALNGQLRSTGGLNALQICAVRQVLYQMQQT